MAKFALAYTKVIEGHEAGYVNDPDDKGGETFDGISRNANPYWSGWDIIDAMKNKADFPKCLYKSGLLLSEKQILYFRKYWAFWMSDLKDQELANKVFDLSVNSGLTTAVRFFQKTINLLNNNGKLYGDIEVDGIFGDETALGFSAATFNKPNKLFLNVLNGYHVKKYIELMEKNPINEKYIGWFKRVEISW